MVSKNFLHYFSDHRLNNKPLIDFIFISILQIEKKQLPEIHFLTEIKKRNEIRTSPCCRAVTFSKKKTENLSLKKVR
jgi:hypothetical protein